MKSWLTLIGCTLFALPLFSQLKLTFDKTDPSCFNYTNGIAIVNASGGVGPYTYQWQNGNTWNQWWGIPAGTYSVTATDANGATVAGSVTLNHPPLLTVTMDAVDVFCEGFQGQLEAKPKGGTPPYNYAWSNGMSEAIATNITTGDWMVTVLDSKQCHDVGTRYIDIPSQIFPNIVPTHPTCATCENGSIVVSTFGNHPPFVYTWENGSTSTTLTGLLPGNYPLTITDQNNCALAFQTPLMSPFGPITVEATGEPITCFGQKNGVVKAVVTGGSGTHTFVWKDQSGQIVGTDGIVQNLGPGTYCLTVTDNTGTTGTDCATVTEPTKLQPSISITPTPTGGTVTITIVGGTPPYKMTLDGAVITSLVLNLPPKNYYYLCVMDANGCQVDIPFEILNPNCMEISLLTSSTQCASANSGSATAVVTGGSGNYMYTWSVQPSVSMPTITGLPGGPISVTVTDLNNPNCVVTASAVIVSHTTIILSATATDASCSGVADGSATVTASNGLGNYTYEWNTIPVQTTQTITGLLPGSYQVTVTDASNCTSTTAVNVGTGSAPNAAFSIASIECNGATSTVNFVNNSTNFTSSVWYFPNNQPFNGTTPPPLITSSGQSLVIELVVSNDSGCSDTESHPITIPAGPQISVPATIKECADSINISISAPAGLTFSWTGPNGFTSTEQNPTVLNNGTYSVTASNSVGCNTTGSVEVTILPGIDISLKEEPVDVCDNATLVSATTANGATVTWTLNGGTPVNGPTFASNNLIAGSNILIATASNGGCTGTDTILIESNPLTGLSLTGDNKICLGEQAMISVTPAPTGATYEWDPSAPNGPTSTNTPTAAGPKDYHVTVTNASGCTTVLDFLVDVAQPTVLDPASFTSAPCNNRFVQFNGPATPGGTWNFGDPNSGTANNTSTLEDPSHIFSAPGNFTVTFTPATDCTDPIELVVNVKNDDVITAAFDATLGPDCSNIIELSLKDKSLLPAGSTIYSWNVNTVPATVSSLSNPSTIVINQNGTYTVTLIVKSAAGCLDTLKKELTPITDLITVPNFPKPTLCPGDCANLNPSGNTAYAYQWSGGLTGPNPSVCPTETTTYTVTITNNNHCVLDSSVTVTVKPAAAVNAGPDISVCSNDPVTLTATGIGDFCWSLNPNFIPCFATGSTATIDPAQVSTVYVKSTAGSCTDIDTINIKNNTLTITGNPPANPISDCLGTPVPFGVNSIPGKTLTFIWSNGMTVDMLTEAPTATTTYSVTATDAASGCTDELSFTVEVIDLQPKLTVSASKLEVCPNEHVALMASMSGTSGPYTYKWEGAGLDFYDRADPIATPTDSTTYTVTVTDEHGCTAVDDVRLRYINVTCNEPFIFLPNAFTPFDNNEVNNVLYVRGNNIKEMDFYIYDRWGEKMFESHNPNEGWNGKFKDKELTPDAYGFYLRVTCNDNTTFKKQGNVTLLR